MSRFGSALVTMAAVIGGAVDVHAQAAPPPPAAPVPPAAAATNAPRDRSGVVLVEQAGRVLGLGVILNEDGRVLTAAARLTAQAAGPLFVRYPDGKLVQARIGHTDRERGLALLVPKTVATRKGIQAARSKIPSAGSTLGSFAASTNRNVGPIQYTVKNTPQSGGQFVLELSPAPKASDLGSPLLDTQGQAVGIVVSGCLGSAPTATPTAATPATPAAPPCARDPVGMPLLPIRLFLRALPADADPIPPWLGIDGISADTGVVRGIRVGRLEPKSPAAALPLQASTDSIPGDLLVAVGGQPVPTLDALESVLSGRAAGERVELLVFGKDGFRTHPVRLAERPAPAP